MTNVLLITQTPIYPLHNGGAQAQYYFIDGLKDDFNLSLCTVVRSESEKNGVEALALKQPKLKVHCLDLSPAPKKKGVKSIIRKILYYRRHKGGSSEPIDDFSDSYFMHVDHPFNERFINLINETIVEDEINVVQFDFYDCIDIVFALPANIKKVFVHHEVRFKRLQLASAKSDCSEEYKRFLISKTEAFEKACLPYMDKVAVFNDDDARILSPYCKQPVTVSPFAIPDEQIYDINCDGSFDHLLFVGGEGHTPNAVGLKWFLDSIYIPLGIEIPLHITGTWSKGFREGYETVPGIKFTGILDSMEPEFHRAIFINPILTGAGIRTKVLHALACGVPVLSTRFGAEGCWSDKESAHLAFFDSAEEFNKVIGNSDFKQLAAAGKKYYNTRFNKERLLGIRRDLLAI